MNAAMYQPKFPLGSVVDVTLKNEPSTSITVTINDTGPFARGSNGKAVYPLRPDPNKLIDLTPAAFQRLIGDMARGIAPVNVTRQCP